MLLTFFFEVGEKELFDVDFNFSYFLKIPCVNNDKKNSLGSTIILHWNELKHVTLLVKMFILFFFLMLTVKLTDINRILMAMKSISEAHKITTYLYSQQIKLCCLAFQWFLLFSELKKNWQWKNNNKEKFISRHHLFLDRFLLSIYSECSFYLQM